MFHAPLAVRRIAQTALALGAAMTMAGLGALACQTGAPAGGALALTPASMARVGTIDDRFQSYNVEMLEVTGGKFWKSYGPELDAILKQPSPSTPPGSGDTPSGMNPAIYQYRPPIDLTNARRRKLAAALSPAYVRVSGTWANTSYFPDSDQAPAAPPAGFTGILTRQQWKGVVDFSRSVDASIVTSFATSAGTRDAAGVWTPVQARRFLAYTASVGGRIAAVEFMNEPSFAAMGGAPAGYDAVAYGRDFKMFRPFVKNTAADTLILGPGSVGETDGNWGVSYGISGTIKTQDMLAAAGPGVDAFSYHHYGASSQRCAPMGQTSKDAALSEEWLTRTDQTLSFYRKLRDEFEPGKAFWVTETADTACGGNPWAATYLDTFRYLDQMGRLAKQDVRVIVHNTLDASDYGLLDENDLSPRPNYWAALLWRTLMGTTVLESAIPIQAGLHLYAHCLRGTPGGVALLAINTDKASPRTLRLPIAADRFTLSSTSLEDKRVQLNGTELKLGNNDDLPRLVAVSVPAGDVTLPPATSTFLALAAAGNSACR